MPKDVRPTEELAPPSGAESLLLRVHVEALISVLGRKDRERYLRFIADRLASPGDDATARTARAMFMKHLTTLVDLVERLKD